MLKTKRSLRSALPLIVGLVSIIILASLLSSCRPRASRSRSTKQSTPTAQQANQPQSPTARQVLQRTDSAMQRVMAMSQESDAPVVAAEPYLGYPRTPMVPYVPRPDVSEYNRFEAGLAAFNGARYDEAIGSFSQVILAGRPAETVPSAYYWIGESYYAMQRYAEALPYFEYTTQVGPQHRKESAFYKLAQSNIRLGNSQAARLWYERLRVEYPKSQYAARLKKALG